MCYLKTVRRLLDLASLPQGTSQSSCLANARVAMRSVSTLPAAPLPPDSSNSSCHAKTCRFDLKQVGGGLENTPALDTVEDLRLRNLALDRIRQGLCVFDRQQRLLLFNRQYAEMYDLDPAQLWVGMTL